MVGGEVREALGFVEKLTRASRGRQRHQAAVHTLLDYSPTTAVGIRRTSRTFGRFPASCTGQEFTKGRTFPTKDQAVDSRAFRLPVVPQLDKTAR